MAAGDPCGSNQLLEQPRRRVPWFRAAVVLVLLAGVPVGMMYFPSFQRPTADPAPVKVATSLELPPEAVTTRPDQFVPEAEWDAPYRERMRSVMSAEFQVRFYGLQRGVPRSDGWVTITSTGAGFSVAMPSGCSDLRMVLKGTNIAMDSVSYNDGELALMASCAHQTDGAPPYAMKAFLEGFGKNAHSDEIRPIQWKGRVIYEGRTHTRQGVVRVRCFADRDGLWTWRAIYPEADEARFGDDVGRFPDSFELPAPRRE